MCKLTEASDSDQLHGCLSFQWLSLVSLLLGTKFCCVTLMATNEMINMPAIT